MYILFRAEGQELRRIDSEIVASDSKGFLRAKFEVDDEWKELGLKAIFEQNGEKYVQVLDDNTCLVPVEVLNTGRFKVWLVGVDYDDVVRATTESVTVEVKRGPGYDAENSTAPTPEEKDQILSAANEAKRIASSVKADADSGKFNAKISSVTAESVPHGTSASVTNIGTGTDANLVFKIPEGKQGNPGKQGPAGDSFYAFYAEEEILSYINDKKPETFEVLWLGETTDETEFGSVYEFNIVYNDNLEPIEFDKVKKGSLRGPEGPAGKDGEVAAAFTDTSGIDAYIANYNVNRLSFIWAGTDDKTYSYTNKYGVIVTVSLKKGDIYTFNINDKKVIGYTKNGNLKGDNGVGISRIERTSGNGAAGTTDTYTITLTDNTVGGTLYVYNGKDGADAELYGIKGYTVKSNADILNLCEKYPRSYFLVVNTGDTFTAMTDTKNLVVNTGDICGVTASQVGFSDIRYLDNSPISLEEATIYHWAEINEDNVAVDRYAAVINGNTDDGVASGSGEYELINTIELAETGENFYDIEITKNNEAFTLKAVTLFCIFPVGTKTAVDIQFKTKNVTAYTSVYRKTSVIPDSGGKTQYYRVRLQNEGYWTGSSVQQNEGDLGTPTAELGLFARNNVQGNAVGIRIATGSSSIKFPAGTTFEIWGVRV